MINNDKNVEERCHQLRSKEEGIRRKEFGAGDRDRTGDVQLGKLAFYH